MPHDSRDRSACRDTTDDSERQQAIVGKIESASLELSKIAFEGDDLDD